MAKHSHISERTPTGKPWRRRLILVCLILLTTGIGTELFARFALGLGDPPLSVAHPTIEYMFKPNQDCQRFGNRVLINQYGMRSEPFEPQKESPDELRVMVFGDSILNGGSLTDHNQLATTLLQQQLSEQLSRPVIVGNISAVSWGPGNYLAYQEEYGWMDADIVLIVLSAQDVEDVPTFNPLHPVFQPNQKPWLASWEGFERYLLPNLWSADETKAPASIKTVHTLFRADVQRDLTALVHRANKAGLLVGTVLWWFPGSPDHGIRPASISDGQGLLEIAQQAGVHAVADLTQQLKNQSKVETIYRDGLHPNAAGQHILQAGIRKAILDIENENKHAPDDAPAHPAARKAGG